MTLVIDASMVVAGLTDSSADGRWAESLLTSDSLAAPHLMPVEAANILRRAALAGDIGLIPIFSSLTAMLAMLASGNADADHQEPAGRNPRRTSP